MWPRSDVSHSIESLQLSWNNVNCLIGLFCRARELKHTKPGNRNNFFPYHIIRKDNFALDKLSIRSKKQHLLSRPPTPHHYMSSRSVKYFVIGKCKIFPFVICLFRSIARKALSSQEIRQCLYMV